MELFFILLLNLLAATAILTFPFLKTKGRGIVTIAAISVQTFISFIVAFLVFANGTIDYSLPGSWVSGEISVKIDHLSAWFMLIISFTFLTGGWYGLQYMKKYAGQSANIAMHAVAFIFAYTSLIDICIVQNGFAMLILWEIMALSSFVVIIFEHNKRETLKAGINFLIQSHISILFLTLGFMWIKIKTGSFDFSAISAYTSSQPASTGIGLFIVLFTGFAIKAGFVPFHTWLPLAHPAAPAHISGIMSGVIIKIGIYGILRMVLLIKTDMVVIGYFIVTISVITGIYGVMLAIVQHNLKKLLAYHSIENIGIIGIGIGLGCLGAGYNNPALVTCGFAGALLHTLNHSLFKSLLFYSAGNVYQATHTMNIEALGGLLKKMPRSGWLFLISALAICGLPPFNGFVSEFFIYTGLFNGIMSDHFLFTLFIMFAILSLVLIGGLAILCFTKAFGIVFLGTPREKHKIDPVTEKPSRIFPMYFIALAIIIIGILPVLSMPAMQKILQLYHPLFPGFNSAQTGSMLSTLSNIGWYSILFIILTAALLYIRYLLTSGRKTVQEETWGCGYTGDNSGMQYTASSFVRTYRKLAGPVLSVKKEKREPAGLYPEHINQVTHPGDKVENLLIEKPVLFMRKVLSRFGFLQNGNIQAYILYGLIFITLAILVPLIIENIGAFINLINRL
jgi:formate hydrogenlyase subunit 3/multisubunit Na+/H+ antiporter MnhD subunit